MARSPRHRALLLLLLPPATSGGLLAGLVAAVTLELGTRTAAIVGAAVFGAVVAALAVLGLDTRRRVHGLGQGIRDLEQLLRRVRDLPTHDQVTSLVRSTVFDARNRLHGDISRLGAAARDDTRQLEALLNLHAMIPVRRALPPSRGWAASPDLLLTYVGVILDRRPELVVECGSGLSTLWAALALETVGGSGRVVALEHDEEFRAGTLAALEEHGVAHRAEIRQAPIENVTLGSQDWPWYAAGALAGLDGVGVLLVDGPVGALGPQARYPALPLLRERLLPGAVVLLDDADRPEEQEVLARWQADWPELSSAMLRLEKGAARLVVPPGTATAGRTAPVLQVGGNTTVPGNATVPTGPTVPRPSTAG